MNTRLKSQIVKELLSFLRDPKSRMTLIGPPLIQLLVFSFAVTLDVRNIDVAVLTEDTGRWSYELVARIGASNFVDEVIAVQRPEQLSDLIDRRRVLAALHIPADFSRNIAAGRAATAQVLVDGRRANSGQIAADYLHSLVANLGNERRGNTRDAMPRSIVRNWFNPNLTYRWFVVPSLAAILAMLIALIMTGLSIAREREMGTFDQLLVSPATPIEIVVGKTVPALLIGTVLATLMIAAGVFLFAIPFSGSFLLLLTSLIVFILSVVGVGLMVSSVCQTQQQALLGVFAIAIPVILISGFATPVENMPRVLQFIAEASPLRHFLVIVQGSFLKALPGSVVFAHLWPLVVTAVLTLSTAVVVVQRRLQ
ncbi:MAG: ABC transporter permease [Gammaproteobacteria bacterium]